MRILMIGDFHDNFDEGLKNIAKYFYSHLSTKFEVRTLNVKQLLHHESIWLIKTFEPDIIHYFTAPTIVSFFLLRFLSLRWPKSKFIISALHPNSLVLNVNSFRILIKFVFTPSAILYQEKSMGLHDISKTQIFLPNGVDIRKFKPVSPGRKLELRKKHGIDADKFVVLHVGHLTKKRNLRMLADIQKISDQIQVLIVCSAYLGVDEELLDHLQKNGCRVIIGYIREIGDIYALSDCYVFPVPWGNTINLPLTILEAMSSNLPVFSIAYPTFSIFKGSNSLFLANDENELLELIKEEYFKLNERDDINNREVILPYSWEKLTSNLENMYGQLVGAQL